MHCFILVFKFWVVLLQKCWVHARLEELCCSSPAREGLLGAWGRVTPVVPPAPMINQSYRQCWSRLGVFVVPCCTLLHLLGATAKSCVCTCDKCRWSLRSRYSEERICINNKWFGFLFFFLNKLHIQTQHLMISKYPQGNLKFILSAVKGKKKPQTQWPYYICWSAISVTFNREKESGFKRNISFDFICNEEWGMRAK